MYKVLLSRPFESDARSHSVKFRVFSLIVSALSISITMGCSASPDAPVSEPADTEAVVAYVESRPDLATLEAAFANPEFAHQLDLLSELGASLDREHAVLRTVHDVGAFEVEFPILDAASRETTLEYKSLVYASNQSKISVFFTSNDQDQSPPVEVKPSAYADCTPWSWDPGALECNFRVNCLGKGTVRHYDGTRTCCNGGECWTDYDTKHVFLHCGC